MDRRCDAVTRLAERYTPGHGAFLRDMIAIPSESAEERAVIERVADEMRRPRVRRGQGGRSRQPPRPCRRRPAVIAFDGHLDTVGVGDPSTWTRDPYQRRAHATASIYGRGAGDQEGGVAAAVYGARIAQGARACCDGCQVWVTGTVMEEDCDGLCWQYILREQVLTPDVVVITEPTNLGVYRGHRGRMEIEVRTQGRSCHGSAPERGVNAVYRMAPIIADIERLNERLGGTRRCRSSARAR